jgi:molecular chaperone HscB
MPVVAVKASPSDTLPGMLSPDFSQTYFELFGLNPVFEVDDGYLRAAQQRLQSSYHPDRYVGANDREKRLSVQIASWINQALETLQDPVKRSRYLLQINGVEIPDDSTTTSDPVFLMEQIELREEVESCRHDKDGLRCCERVESRLEVRAAELAAEFVTRFEARDLDAALQSSRKMQFIQRIQQQLAELQYQLEDF